MQAFGLTNRCSVRYGIEVIRTKNTNVNTSPGDDCIGSKENSAPNQVHPASLGYHSIKRYLRRRLITLESEDGHPYLFIHIHFELDSHMPKGREPSFHVL